MTTTTSTNQAGTGAGAGGGDAGGANTDTGVGALVESMPAGARLAAILDSVDFSTLSNDELTQVLLAQDRQVSHETGRKVELIAQIGRRLEVSEKECHDWPWEMGEFEVQLGLVLTATSASRWCTLAYFAWVTAPAVGQALTAGLLDEARARVFQLWTDPLSQEHTRAVVEKLLPEAMQLTTAQLRKRIAEMAIALDPAWVKRRYERAVRRRRVVGYSNSEGTANVSGYDLPTDQAASACERLDRLARAAKSDGHPDPIDSLRADLFLALLNGDYNGLTDQQIVTQLLTNATTANATTASADPGRGEDQTPPPADNTDSSASNQPTAPNHNAAPDQDSESDQDPDSDQDPESHQDSDSDQHPEPSEHPAPSSDPQPEQEPASNQDSPRQNPEPGPDSERSQGTERGQGTEPGRDTQPAPDTSAAAAGAAGGAADDATVSARGCDSTPDAAAESAGHGAAAGCKSTGDGANASNSTRDAGARAGGNGGGDAGDSGDNTGSDGNGADDDTDGGGGLGSPTEGGGGSGPSDSGDPGGSDPGSSGDASSAGGSDGGAGSSRRFGPSAGLRVMMRLVTLIGLDRRPGRLLGWGPLHAELARSMATTPHATWSYVLVDDDGIPLISDTIRRRPTNPNTPPPAPPTGAAAGTGHTAGSAHSAPLRVWIQFTQAVLDSLMRQPPPGWAAVLTEINTSIHKAAEAKEKAKAKGKTQGREPRFPDAELRRWIQLRDQTCTFGGCGAPGHRCDIDHTVPHAQGGVTQEQNLCCVCRRHHRLRHEGGWNVEQPTPGRVIWTSLLGQRRSRRPPSNLDDLPEPMPTPTEPEPDDLTEADDRTHSCWNPYTPPPKTEAPKTKAPLWPAPPMDDDGPPPPF